ncbi:putative fructokinase-4-like protein [Trifolium pratense]|uniref:Putative fructokinase-4-like protein n=1 Tax=Trifolium pratense TaxID=57577 RepID=A0A2K3JM59_TRIPR|nr:putative fructokinase-4-like protein [Trifolium pratense]
MSSSSILLHHLLLLPNSLQKSQKTLSKFNTTTSKRHIKTPNVSSTTELQSTTSKRRNKKNQPQNDTTEPQNAESDLEDYDDGIDFPYEEPPLVCCFGAAQREFLPTVRVQEFPMDPDIYSEWKMLQWKPPEFARAPGGPPSNVAVAHVRLGGRAALLGKVGDDEFGEDIVLGLNKEKVQTRGVKFDSGFRTGCSYMKVKFEDGKMKMETVKESAEDALRSDELNLAVLKECEIFVTVKVSFVGLS